MYIVTGATGQTGSVVAKTLLEKGVPVRVIVRSEEKGKPWKDLGAEVAIADVRDTDALTAALEGGTVLYLMNPPDYQSEDLIVAGAKVIDAFQKAIENSTLEKIVILSSVAAHLPSGTGPIVSLHRLEDAFNNSPIPVTFVRPVSFMENWNTVLEAVKTEGVLPSMHLPLDAKFPQIATEEIGRVIAASMLEKTEGIEIKELSGIEYSPNDVAEAFAKVLGKPVSAVPVREDQWTEILRSFSSPRNAEIMSELFRASNAGDLVFETGNPIESKVTIDDYARGVLQMTAAKGTN